MQIRIYSGLIWNVVQLDKAIGNRDRNGRNKQFTHDSYNNNCSMHIRHNGLPWTEANILQH